ncbi:MAG: hypothetical protein AAGF12_15265 [Myxococcota bacterium]
MGIVTFLSSASGVRSQAPPTSDVVEAPALPALYDDLDRLEGTFGVVVRARVGFVRSDYPAIDSAEARGRAASTVIRSHYAVVPRVRLGVRVPLLDTNPELPGSSVVTERAFGSPELLVDWAIPQREGLVWNLRLGVGVPMGAGSADPEAPLLQNKAFALVHAVHGGYDPELHQPGRMAITPSARLHYHGDWFHAGALLKTAALIQIGDGASSGRGDTRPLAYLGVVGGHAMAQPVPWFYVGVRSWLSMDIVAPTSVQGEGPTPVDFSLEPQLTFVIADRVQISATTTFVILGELAGVIAPGVHLGLVL